MDDQDTLPGTSPTNGADSAADSGTPARTGKPSRKELLRAFKDAPDVGGVYAIRNRATGRILVQTTTTISKAAGILSFAKLTGSCVHPLVADDWKAFGPDAFGLEILETLERKGTETEQEFADEVRALGELWAERLAKEARY